jgi:hypothetical protein
MKVEEIYSIQPGPDAGKKIEWICNNMYKKIVQFSLFLRWIIYVHIN